MLREGWFLKHFTSFFFHALSLEHFDKVDQSDRSFLVEISGAVTPRSTVSCSSESFVIDSQRKALKSEMLLGITLILCLSLVHSRSYNRYHSEEGDVKHRLSSTEFGLFRVFWDTSDPYFYVIHSAEPEKILFQTLPSQSFVTVGYATDSNPPIVDGNYKVQSV